MAKIARNMCAKTISVEQIAINAKGGCEQKRVEQLNGGGGISFEHEPALNCVNKALNQASTALKNSRCEQQQVGFSFFLERFRLTFSCSDLFLTRKKYCVESELFRR